MLGSSTKQRNSSDVGFVSAHDAGGETSAFTPVRAMGCGVSAGGASAGSPSGAPAADQAVSVAIWSALRDGLSFHDKGGEHSSVDTAPHGGISRDDVCIATTEAYGLVSW